MTRRTLLKLLLASAVAETVDVEAMLWTPRTLITVPAINSYVTAEEARLYTQAFLGLRSVLKDVYDKNLLHRLLPSLVFEKFREFSPVSQPQPSQILLIPPRSRSESILLT